MKKILMSFLFCFIAMSLMACVSNTRNMNAGVGAASGAAVGLLAGNPIIVASGAVVGGAIGYSMNSTVNVRK